MGKKPFVGLVGLLVAVTTVGSGCDTSKQYQNPKGNYKPYPMLNTSTPKATPGTPA